MWIASFESLEEAKAHLREVTRHAVGDCFIYSEEKGIIEFVVHTCTDSTLQ